MNQQQFNRDDALLTMMATSCAVGVFSAIFLASLSELDTIATIETARVVYFKLAATGCGIFFMVILTVLAFDVARQNPERTF